MSQYAKVDLTLKSNVYFDGKCVSHTIHLEDGTRKTVGVIFPSTLRFTTGAPEVMEITGGVCRVRLDGESEWRQYGAGQRFEVAGNSAFDIETVEFLDYVCHFG
ncbi:MAG: hypothetical protein RL333_441 [Pseudomonadota bacterium]|jgi:uncharacterized protein YaiE (UPF0345 family)